MYLVDNGIWTSIPGNLLAASTLKYFNYLFFVVDWNRDDFGRFLMFEPKHPSGCCVVRVVILGVASFCSPISVLYSTNANAIL